MPNRSPASCVNTDFFFPHFGADSSLEADGSDLQAVLHPV
jgi:hypothetical protein